MIIQIEPWIGEEEAREMKEVIDSTFITEWGKTKDFERKFSEMFGVRNAVAYCNGTMSLFVALRILGIGKGDEVLVPDMTFIASSNAILMADATPVFVDIDRGTLQINPKEIERKITSKTKAIMPVHLYGESCEMDKIMEIARKHGLKVVEDAAQGVGVKFDGKSVGTFGDIGVFSFYGNKTITTGEGGMIVTDDVELAKKSFRYKNHGRSVKGTFIHDEIGFNFSFTDMQAAIGLAQLSKFGRIKERKEEIREFYARGLADIPEVGISFSSPRCDAVHWFSNIIVPNAEKLHDFLAENKIQTRRFFYPLHLQPCYKVLEQGADFPGSVYAYEHGLSLPSSVPLTNEQLSEVVKRVREFYGK